MLKSSCFGDPSERAGSLSLCLETVVKTDYRVAFDGSIIFQSSGILIESGAGGVLGRTVEGV